MDEKSEFLSDSGLAVKEVLQATENAPIIINGIRTRHFDTNFMDSPEPGIVIEILFNE
jgi:hypothetical protein